MAETITGIAVFVIFLSANSALLHAAPAQPSHPSPSPPDCVRDLVAFSPCLSYVSAPPNNITVIPALECCGVVSSALNSNGSCLCYLLRQPLIFSFPLNLTRVASLPRLCNWRDSLDSLCSSGIQCLLKLQIMKHAKFDPLHFKSSNKSIFIFNIIFIISDHNLKSHNKQIQVKYILHSLSCVNNYSE